MKKVLERAGFRPTALIALLLVLTLVGVFHYILFHHQVDLIEQQCVELDKNYKTAQWEDIETLIDISLITAKKQATEVAKDIVEDLNAEYPDMHELQVQFNEHGYQDPRFLNVIAKSIKRRYMYNIQSTNNDIFMISRSGIVLDMNVDKIEKVYRSFDEESKTHYNERLSKAAFQNILAHKDTRLLYYEPNRPNISDHRQITVPSREDLHAIYNEEGLEGLKGYVFLVPVYITDDGDMFGVPDITPLGTVNRNHKLIIIQRFSLYDILDMTHSRTHLDDITYRTHRNSLVEDMRFASITYCSTMLLDLIALGIIMIYTSRRLPIEKL